MKFVHYTALRPPLLLPLLLLIAIEKQHGVFVFGFVPARLPLRTVQRKHPQQHRSSIRIAAGADDFFATASTATTATDQPPPQPPRAVDVEDSSTKQEPERQLRPQPPPPQRRVLGSQELLMLPRQYGPGPTVFPPMNHVSCTVLSATPDVATLRGAIVAAQHGHPLLRARVEGDGEPVRRIDMFQMVRDGHEPAPLTFVTEDCSTVFQADDVLTVVETDNVETSWKAAFARNLDDGSWCNVTKGPLWKVELHRKKSNSNYNNGNEDHSEEDQSSALLLAFNHAISDQSSVNRLTDQLLRHVAARESATTTNYNIATGTTTPIVAAPDMPVSLEDSVLGTAQRWNDVHTAGLSFDTLQYVASKVTEIWKNPVLLPDEVDRDEGVADGNSNHVMGALSIIAGRAAGGSDAETIQRRSTVQFRSLTRDVTTALVTRCRAQNVSVSNALTAAVTLTCTDFVGDRNSTSVGRKRNYKVLQSLDMRRFGAKLDQGTTVACMAGSHDLMHGPLADQSGRALRKNPSSSQLAQFWQLAADGQKQTKNFIRTNGPRHAVRVFDWAMSISDLNNLVHLTAQSKDTKGRAYSAGVTNVGVYERQLGFPQQDEQDRKPLQIQYGRYKVQDVYFATSHVTTGCLYQVSALTVDGQLKLTFNPVEPIVSAETNAQFADAFVELLETVVGDPIDTHPDDDDLNTNQSLGLASLLSVNALPAATAVLGLAAVATHSVAWAKFFTSVMEMKANVANPADFWAAMNFWIFFAVGHPILQPILWISDVLHGSPGPVIAGLVPATFLMGNLIVIAAVIVSKEVG